MEELLLKDRWGIDGREWQNEMIKIERQLSRDRWGIDGREWGSKMIKKEIQLLKDWWTRIQKWDG
jgi:hypothetical protein